jgi:hypothetical protein
MLSGVVTLTGALQLTVPNILLPNSDNQNF